MTPLKLHPLTQRSLEVAALKPAHTYLFVGMAGTGKLAAALNLADLLSQQTPSNITRLAIDKKKTKLGISEIHQLLRTLQMTPLLDTMYRVVIIEEAEALSIEAANALLKILEEPPNQTVFILLARSVSAILPTIRSRSVVIRFLPLNQKNIEKIIGNDTLVSKNLIVPIAQGRLDYARNLAEDDELYQQAARLYELAGQFLSSTITDKFAIAKTVHEQANHSKFLEALYIQAQGNLNFLTQLFFAEQCLNAHVSSRLVFENLALGIQS